MTKRKVDQTCVRCRQRLSREGKSTLCDDCRGRCVLCGNPALLMSNGSYRKYCGACRHKAELQAFCARCKGVRDGTHGSYCRSCFNEYAADWSKRNPEKRAAHYRRGGLRQKYGLTLIEWESMLDMQGGVCAICRTDNPGRGAFSVDHDHACCPGDTSCGRCLRGLLCHNCNNGLGRFHDNAQALRAAADYLERFSPATA